MDNKEKAIPKWNAIRQDFTPYILVFLGVFLLLSLFSFTETEDGTGANWFGRIGYYVSFTLFYLLGKSSFLLAGFSLILGVISFKNPEFDRLGKALFFPLFIIGSSVALNILETPLGQLGDGGGIFGQFFSWVLNYLFGETGRIIVVFFLFLYSAVIWLEDSTWNFTLGKLQFLTNAVYKGLGGTRDLSHWKLPSFINETILPQSNLIKPVFGGEVQSKKWFERKSESDFDMSLQKPPIHWEEEPNESYFPKEIKKTESPKLLYKNTSLYEGFFEESGDTFRFHKTSVSLQKKLRTESFATDVFKIKVSDFRGLDVPEIIEEIATAPLEIIPEQIETNTISGTLASRFPETSRTSSLHNPISKFSFDDIDLYPGRKPVESDLDLETDDLEEDIEAVDEMNDDALSLPISAEEEEEWEEEFPSSEAELEDSSDDEAADTEPATEEDSEEEDEIPSNVYALEKPKAKLKKEEKKEFAMGSMVPIVKLKKGSYYISPKLLADHKQPPSFTAKFDSELETVGGKIEEIIGYYGIESKVIARERGPIITRYELTIPHGIKLSRITSLSDELKLHLAVKNIRIVAPIPGKSSIGIEVPNIHREDVFLSEILKESILQNKTKDLTIAIGKDISGKTVIIDLAKLPHLLVAGTTGSGKSVSLNSMITSLICTRSPEEVRFIMIDPKMVEMTLYEDIPHLLMPVITDPKKATKALSWAIQEMESRYQMVSQLKSRDFKSYNDKVDEFAHKKGYQKFPYIVIFIDELADLMMVSGKDLEDQITRISQKSRAVGIHLVMATQRPSVDVITGLIKANCPARVAFHVAQKTDSRTILDTNGAESLLGKGDFLYRSPTTSDLTRIQAPYIEEKEIEAIVEEAKKQGAPAYVEMNWEEEGSTESGSDEDEELFDEAWNIVVSEKKASASYLQRRMRIGYNKAARLMELMEMRGYVSPQIGSKPREILRSA
ncbi:DNA translocase FtsK 4TM domain-containing protein [Leptospira sp. 'Mane']|uniref:FtsK/SpoIIIE family DNA translocase n=1 Tax=Leptospira sp. 'Mane' TaxID=3387407 RepID=UPI00398AAA94